MPVAVTMPALGLTMTEGTIHAWLKRIGEPVGKDEPLVAVETDKAVMDVVAPAAGVLGEVLAREGERVPVNGVIGYLVTAGEAVPSLSPALSSTPGEREPVGLRDGVRSSPLTLASQTRTAESAPPSQGTAVLPLPRALTVLPSRGSDGREGVGGEGTQPRYPAPVVGTDRERLIWLYRTMVRIRAFDERIVVLFSAGKIAGALHSYVGEEAVAAGVAANLRPDDKVVSTHRGHGHLLAKGGDMNRMMAELFGKVDGYCKGKGGSMHITDVSLGILGANGIVGAGIPIASGAGTAIKLQGTDQVVVCFFGDGAANIGTFHEGVNLAATWSLPVVFVCENNGYAQFTPQRLHTRQTDVYRKAEAYGIPGHVVDGNDATEVAAVSAEAIARARQGAGPTLIEAKTFRWYGHAINNPASAIGRDEAEITAWKAKDPIPRLEQKLLSAGITSQADLAAIRASVTEELEESIRFAEASPAPRPEDALLDVYAELPEGVEL
jgi:pyruvate dehydrogenase E1 component alpha subunit